MFIELKFIVDFIFLTEFQKLASQRNFHVNKIPSTGRPVFFAQTDLTDLTGGLYFMRQKS